MKLQGRASNSPLTLVWLLSLTFNVQGCREGVPNWSSKELPRMELPRIGTSKDGKGKIADEISHQDIVVRIFSFVMPYLYPGETGVKSNLLHQVHHLINIGDDSKCQIQI